MYRILIVDDEPMALYSTAHAFPWADWGFDPPVLMTEAPAALDKLRTERFDAAIVDIRMPQMDGLELQEALKCAYPDILLVMLSGYDELDYVRQALKNGAIDYILKHELNAQVLEQTLRTAQERIQKPHTPEDDSTDSQLALKRDFVMKLISGCYRSEQEITARAGVLELKLGLKSISVILMQVQPQKGNMIAAYLLEYSILNIVDEILQDYRAGICCHVSDEKYVFLLCYEGTNSSRVRAEIYQTLCARIRACLQTYLNLSAEFYEGQTVPSAVQVPKSYLSAEQKYENRFFSDAAFKETTAPSFDILSVFDAAREKQLAAAIRQNQPARTHELLNDVFAQLSGMQPSADALQISLWIFSARSAARGSSVGSILQSSISPQTRSGCFTASGI